MYIEPYIEFSITYIELRISYIELYIELYTLLYTLLYIEMPICKKLVKKGLTVHLLKIVLALLERVCFDCVSFSSQIQKKLVYEKPSCLRSP